MSTHILDVDELARQLDIKRRDRNLTWRQVADLLDVSASTFSRLSDGKRPSADALVSILHWLDLDISYVTKPREDS